MIIESSVVAMSAARTYNSMSEKTGAVLTTTKEKAKQINPEKEKGQTAVEQLRNAEKEMKKAEAEQRKANERSNVASMLCKMTEDAKKAQSTEALPDRESMSRSILQDLLDALMRAMGKKVPEHDGPHCKIGTPAHSPMALTGTDANPGMNTLSGLYGSNGSLAGKSGTTGNIINISDADPAGAGSRSSNGTFMTKIKATSEFFSESEVTTFQTTGVARTTDGREIGFGVSLEMSRSFTARFESFTRQDYFQIDPLVINIDASTAKVSDQKFYFDLDSDGKKDYMSFAGEGSGFLALDKNGDGKINDGSELFGTKSGDGFKDLAAYDSDGNGWIDEADDVFKDLRVWTKDASGNNKLLSLKDANVGAIYLGSEDTEFSLNDAVTNENYATVRKTGFFLKENGGTGTVQHVDFSI